MMRLLQTAQRTMAMTLALAIAGNSSVLPVATTPKDVAPALCVTTQALTSSVLMFGHPIEVGRRTRMNRKFTTAGGYHPSQRVSLPLISALLFLVLGAANHRLSGQTRTPSLGNTEILLAQAPGTPSLPNLAPSNSPTLTPAERDFLLSWLKESEKSSLRLHFEDLTPPYRDVAAPYLAGFLADSANTRRYAQFNAGRALVSLTLSGYPSALIFLSLALPKAPPDVADALAIWLYASRFTRPESDIRFFGGLQILTKIFKPYEVRVKNRLETERIVQDDVFVVLEQASNIIMDILVGKSSKTPSSNNEPKQSIWNGFNAIAIILGALLIGSLRYLHRKKYIRTKTDGFWNDYLPTLLLAIVLLHPRSIHYVLPFFREHAASTWQDAYLPAQAITILFGLYVGLLFSETLQTLLLKALFKANARKTIQTTSTGTHIFHDSWIPSWAVHILTTVISMLPAILILGSYSLTGTDLFSRVGMLLSVLLGILAIQMIANETIGQLFVWQENNRLSKPARTTLLGIAVSALSAYAIFNVPDLALAAQYFTFVALLVFVLVSPWVLAAIPVYATYRWLIDRKETKMHRHLHPESA